MKKMLEMYNFNSPEEAQAYAKSRRWRKYSITWSGTFKQWILSHNRYI